jgi:NADPH2:quinone reductase
MKAIVINEYGGPECLEYADAPTPEPGPNEVLIKSKFIGVNFTDIRNRVGDGDGVVPMIIGVEASGQIVKLGPGCTKFKVGDFVTSFTRGHAYAEYVTGLEKFTEKISEEFAQKPESAGILVTVPLALNVVERAGRIRPGETVLLHAASGGVGSIIGQLVKKIEDTRLFGTISDSSKSGYAKKNGYDELMSYEEFADRAKELTNGKGVDAILDPVGGEVQKRSLEIVAPFGRLVSYSNISRAPMDLPSALWFRSKCIGFVGISNGSLSEHSPAILAETLRRSVQLVEDGTIRIDVTEVLPLAEASKAHAIFESRAATGKFILAV